MWLLRIAAVTCVVFGTTCPTFAGPIYSAVDDFSISSNPNGQWQYLANNGTGNSLLSTQFNVFPKLQGWINTSTIPGPNIPFIGKNTSGSTLSMTSIVLPTNLLDLDGETLNATVRWTAPVDGLWSITALFQGVDISEGAHSVEILEDASTVLLAPSAINSFGQMANFNGSVFLNAGDTIDFVEVAGNGGFNLATGMSATIAPIVPEPTSLILTGISTFFVLHYWMLMGKHQSKRRQRMMSQ